jgi:hypothetical protein
MQSSQDAFKQHVTLYSKQVQNVRRQLKYVFPDS